MDREKVIKSLHCRGQDLMIDLPACDGCNYQIQLVNRMGCDYRQICRDALALLKEQQHQIWEFQDQVEYLTDKLKEQEAVVRCKDCVFGKREKNDSTGMTWIYCGHHRENRPEDWFCASGSRI